MKRFLILAVAALAGCGMLGIGGGPSATANLQPTKGNKAAGTIKFTQSGDKVRVVGEVTGLRPGAEHGFHIHEAGDCSSGDGMSTKGHYNPQGKPHGNPSSANRHAGDMPALKADANGVANQKFMLMGPTVSAGTTSLVEHAVIVHAAPDDYTTQPTGNSGARIACGVIAGM